MIMKLSYDDKDNLGRFHLIQNQDHKISSLSFTRIRRMTKEINPLSISSDLTKLKIIKDLHMNQSTIRDSIRESRQSMKLFEFLQCLVPVGELSTTP